VVEEIARLGAINSLAQVLLKLTAPGVPDIYQGQEIWDFSLVDPDNRRAVDYEQRRQMLTGLTNADPADLLASWPDGRIKMFLTQRMLRFRRDNAELFLRGSYVPLRTMGTHAGSCVAFAREHENRWIVVLVPRLTARVGFPPIGEHWQDTAVELPQKAGSGTGARDLFTERELRIENGALRLADALAVLPFAVFATA
jgi:(1->4)-alpha-D-glucan 1-alpha-D-glucosylmutase